MFGANREKGRRLAIGPTKDRKQNRATSGPWLPCPAEPFRHGLHQRTSSRPPTLQNGAVISQGDRPEPQISGSLLPTAIEGEQTQGEEAAGSLCPVENALCVFLCVFFSDGH